ncbi:SWIM zinc finger family protein [Bacillus sp. MHSD_36]|uniref:SWIM zinc finger family protein n=1 Tax=unclassified Bacillus (in: firmicutes) TaxID=185979 RepID=UPI00274167EB|nr:MULTISPECIES: SWIM zinc finger family protein [unclassified Bacillus (in: firmicutes)]MDD1369181.1 SWIM zinc finger family protein [Bacillus sp. MHSD17]MDP7988659.1 SWIM zinc finger family protein [Bacillus sp. MHSD_36]MDR4978065.1 SWIM zinc finger family protein [Bacillus sp. MHSD_37]
MYAYLIKELYTHIPKYIMDKGYEYYEEGHVEDVEIQDKKIFAFVIGNAGNYEVIIDLEDFTESSCECPYENYCKHMAAVVYDIQGTGESTVKEKLNDLEKEELLTVLNRLLQSSKNVQIVEKMLKKGKL